MSFARKLALVTALLTAAQLLMLLFAGKVIDSTAAFTVEYWGVSLPGLVALVLVSALFGAFVLLAMIALFDAIARSLKRVADASTSRWLAGVTSVRELDPPCRAFGPQPLRMPLRALATLAGVAAASTIGLGATLVFLEAMFEAGVAAMAFLLPVLVTLLVVIPGAWLLPAFRRARTTKLALDEGGVRLTANGRTDYWDYALLGGASVERSRFGLEQLHLVDRDARSVVKIPLLGSAQEQKGHSVAKQIDRAVAAVRRSAGAPVALHRRGRPIEAWCAEIDRWLQARRRDTYRASALEREVLLALLESGTDVELRAGATYALLSSVEPELVGAAMDSLAVDSPPLVLIMAELATDAQLPELLELRSSLEFLEQEDRVAALALLSRRKHAQAKLRISDDVEPSSDADYVPENGRRFRSK